MFKPVCILWGFIAAAIHSPCNHSLLLLRGHLQLTQKKTALQFKTLDQTLQTFNKETGQKQALSYRCADIDRIVPSLMGVSKVMPASI